MSSGFAVQMTMKNSRLVFSTATGKTCPVCEKAEKLCSCKRGRSQQDSSQRANGGKLYADGYLRIRRETKGRKGKGVTLVDGLNLPPQETETLARQLKNRCGSGGTVKNGMIEIQGDHRATVQEYLHEQGYKTKLAGG